MLKACRPLATLDEQEAFADEQNNLDVVGLDDVGSYLSRVRRSLMGDL